MANYNCDEPKERGFWYDVQVTRKVNTSNINLPQKIFNESFNFINKSIF